MKEVEVIKADEDEDIVFDPEGFFVIFLKGGEIVVEHYLNVNKGGDLEVETGSLCTVVKGKSAKAICDTIVRKKMVSRLDHASYLGRELQKEEIALKDDLEYVQCESIYYEH